MRQYFKENPFVNFVEKVNNEIKDLEPSNQK